jgi:integrase
VMRKARHAAGSRMFEADELRKLIEVAGVPMKAMLLLGINCGFGQTDVAELPAKALNGKWLDFPRPKTQMARRCPLWPETVAALREAMEARPDAKDEADDGLVFITKYGKRWVRVKPKRNESGNEKAGVPIDSVRMEFDKLLSALGSKRPDLSFYAIRHTFRTIADRSKDQPAVDHLMGHVRDDMASVYRERIDDDRLEAVVKVVHDWLFATERR